MKSIKTLLLPIFIFYFAGTCYASDWKALHEEAAVTSYEKALEAVNLAPESQDKLYVLGLVLLSQYKYTEAGDNI